MTHLAPLKEAIEAAKQEKPELNKAVLKGLHTQDQADAFVKAAKSLNDVQKHTPKEHIPTAAYDRIESVRKVVDAKATPAIEAAHKANKKVTDLTKKLEEFKKSSPKAEELATKQKALDEATTAAAKANKTAKNWQGKLDKIDKVEVKFRSGENSLKTIEGPKYTTKPVERVGTDGKKVQGKEVVYGKTDKNLGTRRNASRVSEAPATAKAFKDTNKAFEEIVDKDAINKTKASKMGLEELKAANDNVGKTSWVKKLAPKEIAETFKGSSTGVKFARVAGTGLGVTMIYDGVFHGKRGEQDRSALGRIGEVAAGLGIVGVSLAAGGKGR